MKKKTGKRERREGEKRKKEEKRKRGKERETREKGRKTGRGKGSIQSCRRGGDGGLFSVAGLLHPLPLP